MTHPIATHLATSVEQTEQLAATFAAQLQAGDVITLSGDLGAGKTAFARGVLHGLGYAGRVTSPTFAIANEYQTPTHSVAHFDLYRLLDEESLYEIGFEDYLDGQRILLIEWSQIAQALLPPQTYHVTLTYGEGEDTRRICIMQN